MTWRVGAARTVKLWSVDGGADGYALEMRRLLDGTVVFRVLEPGSRAGLTAPVIINVAAVAASLAKNAAFRIETPAGYYSFVRERDWIMVAWMDFQKDEPNAWRASLAELLFALRDFGGRRAA